MASGAAGGISRGTVIAERERPACGFPADILENSGANRQYGTVL